MPNLSLYNSLARKKEEFIPLDDDHVRIYACGPTVYNYAHIGNARMAVVFDVLARLLKRLYPNVTYVSNITDVDDKIIAAAKDTGEDVGDITRKYTAIYNEDMAALGVRRPDIQPRATGHIDEMIALVQRLIEKGHAYENEGHVLFNVPSYEKYGALSGRSRDEQIAGARVEVAPYKKDPADFVLWKPSDDGQPGWDSPWGRGRPGWHIECSAMAERHLGLPFDIHGGGADLKFPHHENEIAQSCCAHNAEDDPSAFAKVWIHNGFLTVEGEKMSKSLGNVVLVHDLLKQNDMDGAIIRMTLISTHYRQPLDWNAQCRHQARSMIDRIGGVLTRLADVEAEDTGDIYPPVLEALCDDLNTPLALSRLGELIKDINKADADSHPSFKAILMNTLDLLGVEINDGALSSDVNVDNDPKLQALLEERQNARAEKNFQRADEIRDTLAEMGLSVEDTPKGPKLRKIS